MAYAQRPTTYNSTSGPIVLNLDETEATVLITVLGAVGGSYENSPRGQVEDIRKSLEDLNILPLMGEVITVARIREVYSGSITFLDCKPPFEPGYFRKTESSVVNNRNEIKWWNLDPGQEYERININTGEK